MTLIGVTGYKNSGKNSVCDVLRDEYGFKITAFSDALKAQMLAINPVVTLNIGYDGPLDGAWVRLREVVEAIGWDRAKEEYPEVRRLLQYAGTEGGRDIFGQNIWVDTWARTAVSLLEQGDVCVSDMRFVNEAKTVWNLGGKVWRVHRPGTVAGSHRSERELDQIVADVAIDNDGSLDDLRGLVLAQ